MDFLMASVVYPTTLQILLRSFVYRQEKASIFVTVVRKICSIEQETVSDH